MIYGGNQLDNQNLKYSRSTQRISEKNEESALLPVGAGNDYGYIPPGGYGIINGTLKRPAPIVQQQSNFR